MLIHKEQLPNLVKSEKGPLCQDILFLDQDAAAIVRAIMFL